MASIVADCTRYSPSSPKRETIRGWSWLFQYRLFQPISARPACQRPNDALRSRSRNGADVPLARALVQRDVLELEDHVDLGPRRVGEQHRLLDGHAGHLADGDQHRVEPGEHLAVHLGEELVDAAGRR